MAHLNEDLRDERVGQGLAYFVEFRHSPSLYRVAHMPFGKFLCCSDYRLEVFLLVISASSPRNPMLYFSVLIVSS